MRLNTITSISILIIFLTLFFRLQYLDKPFYRDEPVFIEPSKNIYLKGTLTQCENCLNENGRWIKTFNLHPPFFPFYLSFVQYFFGSSEIVLRFFIVLFSVASVILIYFVGKEIDGKRTGIIAAFLLAIARLHVEHSQVIDIDGSFFTFFTLLSIYMLLKWFKSENRKYFILSIATMLVSILIKETAVLVLPAIFIILIKKRKFFKFLKLTIPIFIIAPILILIFGILLSTNFYEGMRQTGGLAILRIFSTGFSRPYQYFGITTWDITPPAIIFSLIALIHSLRHGKEDLKFLSYIVICYFAFFSLVLGITRYFVPIIPLLCLLCAEYFSKLDIHKNDFVPILISVILSLTALFLLKVRTDVLFLSDVKTNAIPIGTVYLLPILALTLFFTNYKKYSLLILFGLIVGYNLFFSQEIVNPIFTPNFREGVIQASDFIKKNSIKNSIFTMLDMSYYSNVTYYDIEITGSMENVEKLVKEGKVQYFAYRTDSLTVRPAVKEFLESNCTKTHNGFSKGLEIFKIYKCG